MADQHPLAGAERADLQVQDYGDSAILLTSKLADRLDRWRHVHRLADSIERNKPHGVSGAIATFDTVLVEFDCVSTSPFEVRTALAVEHGELGGVGPESRNVFEIPVVYGGEYGPDLNAVAQELGVDVSVVISAHIESEHVIRCVASPPGAPMTDMSNLPAPVPRRSGPRSHVPAGSVALAGRQAIIYATSSPGGWRLIGRTPMRLFDASKWPPVGYAPGDRLRFVPIRPADWSLFGSASPTVGHR